MLVAFVSPDESIRGRARVSSGSVGHMYPRMETDAHPATHGGGGGGAEETDESGPLVDRR